LQEFAVDIEVMITSHPRVVRELHVRCAGSSKVLKRFTFITELNVPWNHGIKSTSSMNDSPMVAACVLLELSSLVAGSSRKPVPPPPWFCCDSLVLVLRPLP